jgi:hypothetical protein
MKKIAFLLALSFTLVGCEERYRYPCQDPENAEKVECNRPVCEADGMCYDTLNGLPPQQSPVEEVEAAPAADCNCNIESTGE